MQVTAPAVGNLADSRDFVMMVKGFSGEEMKLAGEQYAHHQGVHPEPEPRFSTASHCSNSLFPWIGPKPTETDNRVSKPKKRLLSTATDNPYLPSFST